MTKLISVLMTAGLLLVSSAAFAESATTTIYSVDTHPTYLEITVNNTVCAGLASAWGKKLHVNHSDASKADFALRIALAAFLAGKPVTVEATSNAGRCYIDSIQIQ
jgi:hypothetical protein